MPFLQVWISESLIPGQIPVYDEIRKELRNLVEDVILNKNKDSTEKLAEFAVGYKNTEKIKIRGSTLA